MQACARVRAQGKGAFGCSGKHARLRHSNTARAHPDHPAQACKGTPASRCVAPACSKCTTIQLVSPGTCSDGTRTRNTHAHTPLSTSTQPHPLHHLAAAAPRGHASLSSAATPNNHTAPAGTALWRAHSPRTSPRHMTRPTSCVTTHTTVTLHAIITPPRSHTMVWFPTWLCLPGSRLHEWTPLSSASTAAGAAAADTAMQQAA
jgi:hypothetical protein